LRDHDFHTSYETLSSLFVPTPVFLEKKPHIENNGKFYNYGLFYVATKNQAFFASLETLTFNFLNENSDN